MRFATCDHRVRLLGREESHTSGGRMDQKMAKRRPMGKGFGAENRAGIFDADAEWGADGLFLLWEDSEEYFELKSWESFLSDT